MGKNWIHIVVFLALLFLAASCQREKIEEGVADGSPVDLVIHFGASLTEDVEVSTKSTLTLEPESTITNLYVYIFDSAGNKFYGHFFDGSNLNASSLSDYWSVHNMSAVSSVAKTTGDIHLHTLANGAGCKVVVIANIDAEMVNISPEQLGTVTNYSQLVNLKARLNQILLSRSGYFPMSGELEMNIVKDDSITSTPTSTMGGTLSLRRLDAKIKFNVRVAANSQEHPITITSFTPMTWKVVNVPKTCYVMERTTGTEKDAAQSEEDFFTSSELNYETETATDDFYADTDQHTISVHGFSFYMMENRKEPTENPSTWTYQDRERQKYVEEGGSSKRVFSYAPEYATYVEFSGRLMMKKDDTDGATLSAEVRYKVHLGNFTSNLNDFSVERNHTYTYNIFIRGVNDIRVEVEEGVENEPGASGDVSISRETVLECDAHYTTQVITFHADRFDEENVTWDVKTPFNPNTASPQKTPQGNEITTGIDFEWVDFRVNDFDPEQEGRHYTNNRQRYYPRNYNFKAANLHPTYNVSELVSYLKQQKQLWKKNRAQSDFDDDGKLTVTAFISEYYYEVNPITGKYEPGLWKKVVNQPMRYMHILSDVQKSDDGESRLVGASFTIQQKSIQTIYDITAPGLNSAWGLEHTDEEQEQELVYKYSKNKDSGEKRGNYSKTNGRSNSLKEWNLVYPDGTNRSLGVQGDNNSAWETYLDVTAADNVPWLKTNYRYVRYSCLSRNRDNNGNGVIDADEVRWYMGAESQLLGLFLGGYGIEGDAKLYQRSPQERAGDNWRQHVVASNANLAKMDNNGDVLSDKYPRLIWAEECMTGSDISFTGDGSTSSVSTRCVRNLGDYNGISITAAADEDIDVEPDSYIVVHRKNTQVEGDYTGSMNKYVYYEFDCSRLNKKSIRYYTNQELVRHDEFSESACLYLYFQSASVNQSPIFTSTQSISDINKWLDADENKGKPNKFCPEGYRLCNVRELAILRQFIPENDVNSYFSTAKNYFNLSRTYWSFGKLGSNKKSGVWGWGVSYQKVLMAETGSQQATYSLRCVRDIKQ